jgi:hypothetical protein
MLSFIFHLLSSDFWLLDSLFMKDTPGGRQYAIIGAAAVRGPEAERAFRRREAALDFRYEMHKGAHESLLEF